MSAHVCILELILACAHGLIIGRGRYLADYATAPFHELSGGDGQRLPSYMHSNTRAIGSSQNPINDTMFLCVYLYN